MTPEMTAIALFVPLIIMLFLKVPLLAAIGVPTLGVMFLSGMNIATYAQRLFSAIDVFSLMAIPFFMLAGKLMEVGGMSRRLVRFCNCLVGWMRGGLAHVMIVASAFFGALSGSAAATCAAIGSTMIPDMVKAGYPSAFCAGLQSIAGGLGVIIPPSITFIMYGICANESIGKLFMAGILPGVFLSACLMVMVRIQAGDRFWNIKQTSTFDFKELKESFLDAIPALLVPLIILGGIYSGLFSPTEAGAVAVVYGFLISVFFYKEVNTQNMGLIFGGAVTNSVLVLLTVSISGAFSWLLNVNGVSTLLGGLIGNVASSKVVFLIICNLVFLGVGMFIETCAGILIVTPILLPIAQQVGVDPIHLGVIMTVNLAMGLSTPPVGENQYIASAVAGVPFEQEFKACLPFLATNFLALMVITFVPELSLFLPNLLS